MPAPYVVIGINLLLMVHEDGYVIALNHAACLHR